MCIPTGQHVSVDFYLFAQALVNSSPKTFMILLPAPIFATTSVTVREFFWTFCQDCLVSPYKIGCLFYSFFFLADWSLM